MPIRLNHPAARWAVVISGTVLAALLGFLVAAVLVGNVGQHLFLQETIACPRSPQEEGLPYACILTQPTLAGWAVIAVLPLISALLGFRATRRMIEQTSE